MRRAGEQEIVQHESEESGFKYRHEKREKKQNGKQNGKKTVKKRITGGEQTPQNDIKSIILTIESKGIRNFDCNHWNEVAE